jgi:hypothetical protein
MTRSRLLLIAGLLFASPCAGGTIVQKQGAAALEIRFDAEKPTLTLADLITVTVNVEGTSALRRPVAPLDLPFSAPWRLVTRSTDKRESIGPDRVRWSLTYQFEPRGLDKVPFAFPDVKFRDGDGEERVARWRPIDFTVTTQIGKLDRSLIHDITDIETLPPIAPTNDSWYWWAALAGLGVVLSAVIFAVRGVLRRSRTRTPAEIALYEWRRLVAMKLPEQGRSERFITLLTTLVRRYVERQFALPARRRTTPEFVEGLAALTSLTAEEKQFLTQFLDRCEAIKFARVEMPAAECARWATASRQFLEQRLK